MSSNDTRGERLWYGKSELARLARAFSQAGPVGAPVVADALERAVEALLHQHMKRVEQDMFSRMWKPPRSRSFLERAKANGVLIVGDFGACRLCGASTRAGGERGPRCLSCFTSWDTWSPSREGQSDHHRAMGFGGRHHPDMNRHDRRRAGVARPPRDLVAYPDDDDDDGGWIEYDPLDHPLDAMDDDL